MTQSAIFEDDRGELFGDKFEVEVCVRGILWIHRANPTHRRTKVNTSLLLLYAN
jgi:hypothetical protein